MCQHWEMGHWQNLMASICYMPLVCVALNVFTSAIPTAARSSDTATTVAGSLSSNVTTTTTAFSATSISTTRTNAITAAAINNTSS